MKSFLVLVLCAGMLGCSQHHATVTVGKQLTPPIGAAHNCCVTTDGATCGNDWQGNPIPRAYPIAPDGSLALGVTCTPPGK